MVFFSTLLCVFPASRPTYSQTLSGPRIVSVQRYERAVESSRPVSRRNQRLKKFTSARTREYDEVVMVQWAPGEGGLEPETILQFEYQQERIPRVQVLHIRYPFKVAEVRRAEFIIPAAAIEAGGTLAGWRVRLIRNRRVLAEQKSISWRTS